MFDLLDPVSSETFALEGAQSSLKSAKSALSRLRKDKSEWIKKHGRGPSEREKIKRIDDDIDRLKNHWIPEYEAQLKKAKERLARAKKSKSMR